MAGSALNAFACCGAFRLSSRTTYAEKFYRELTAAEQYKGGDGAFDSSWNTYNSCRNYAIAMAMQTVQLQLDHAAAQRDPRYVTEKLEELEADYQLIPLATDTIVDRRNALASAMALREGNVETAIRAGLTSIFGAGFMGIKTLSTTDVPPFLIGQTTLKSFDARRPGIETKLVQTTSNVSVVGSKTVTYQQVGSHTTAVAAGDKLVVDINCNGRTEVVTVTAADAGSFTATFANGHDSGAICSTAQWPAWIGYKRHLLILLSATACANAGMLRKANNFLDYAMRGTSSYAFVQAPTSSLSAGPYKIGSSLTGHNVIGTVSFS